MTNDNAKPTGLGALAQRVILCDMAVKAAKRELDDATKERTDAKELMHAGLAEHGVNSVKYHGYTVYTNDRPFASLAAAKKDPSEKDDAEDDDDAGDKTAAIATLKAQGLGWMVKEAVNVKTLTSWVRELPVDPETKMPVLPPELEKAISIFIKEDIGVTKAS